MTTEGQPQPVNTDHKPWGIREAAHWESHKGAVLAFKLKSKRPQISTGHNKVLATSIMAKFSGAVWQCQVRQIHSEA